MAFQIHRIDYFYTTVRDEPGEAYTVLSKLADLGVNLLAFIGVPMGPTSTQLTLFPEKTPNLVEAAAMAGLELAGPNPALFVRGDDELGVLATVHARLFDAGVNVYASYCVTGGQDSFGYVLYVRPDEYERAAQALGV